MIRGRTRVSQNERYDHIGIQFRSSNKCPLKGLFHGRINCFNASECMLGAGVNRDRKPAHRAVNIRGKRFLEPLIREQIVIHQFLINRLRDNGISCTIWMAILRPIEYLVHLGRH